MDIFSRLSTALADARLGANLIAVHGLVTVTIIVSLVLRRLVRRGGSRVTRWTGLPWLQDVGDEAARRARALLFWLTSGVLLTSALAGVGYHMAGRDIRSDVENWYARLTPARLLRSGLRTGVAVAVLLAAWLAVRAVRRLMPVAHAQVRALLGKAANEDLLARWFVVLQLYLVTAIRLGAAWVFCHFVGLGELGDVIVGFLMRVITIVAVSRLLTLSCHVLSHFGERLGGRYLATGPLRNYWERVTRLFPFGERCFEAAVYVSAAWFCVQELHFLDPRANYGPKIVQCIGIFFVTRVLIELLQVLLGELFGLYSDSESEDQKARTLAPLLYSVSQYVFYFGSALMMLQVFEVDTKPILAGVGILGLAVGLGAQSLVSDVVSGFFILFENQFLVGDFVEIGDAAGKVEAVGIRVTQVRDGQGKLHIIPNGQIKGVVSYSKGYVNAVVDHRVPAGSDLEAVFRAMAEAGRRLRQVHHEVLAETQIHGLVELGTTEMTVRAVTRVRPGTHGAMQNEYRRLLKQVFDEPASPHNTSGLAA
jgi:small conductance mechanosensitive channel